MPKKLGLPREDMAQINISIPKAWKNQLENTARIVSVEEGKNITFLDLMRQAIKEKFQLDDIS